MSAEPPDFVRSDQVAVPYGSAIPATGSKTTRQDTPPGSQRPCAPDGPRDLLIVEDTAPCRHQISSIARAAFPNANTYASRSLHACTASLSHRSIDLALVDLQLRRESGIVIIEEIARRHPSLPCIVVTTLDDDAHVFASLAAGATGYLLKNQPQETLVEQLRQHAHGVPALSPAIAQKLIQYFSAPIKPPKRDAAPSLSQREKDVLQLIAKGQRIVDVAQKLNVSTHTVCTHLKSIYRKRDVSTRAEAALEARRLGLV